MPPLLYVNGRLVIKRILAWQLWGVLLCGITNGLLYERGGELFMGHVVPLLSCVVVLAMIGGLLTPEKPLFTAVIFAFGSVPLLNDMPPIPIGLWPSWSLHTRHVGTPEGWLAWLYELPSVLAVTAGALIVMALLYAPLVYLGWIARITRTETPE